MGSRKSKRDRNIETAPAAATDRPVPLVHKTRRIVGWRKWVLRLVLMIGGPLLFLGLLEGGLRWGGYGNPTQFFIRSGDGSSFRTNERFSQRFFPSLSNSPIARGQTRSFADVQPCILSNKPAGAIRIFVFGSSAAQGFPDRTFGFGRILEVMLRERYPGVQFEVVNAALTCINSHVVLEIAKDCAALQPDLFIVYEGNNEVVGPFGPGTSLGKPTLGLTTIRASIFVKGARLGQLIGDVSGRLRRTDDMSSSEEMKKSWFTKSAVSVDDSRLEAVYDNMAHNLADIAVVASRAGAPLIVSTVATNLKDFPPFASQHRDDLSSEDRKSWESAYQEGFALDAAGKTTEALQKYNEAARLDDRFADLQFRMGQCFFSAGKMAEAREAFKKARDRDVLRFRADSRLNEVIRTFAADRQADGIWFLDAEQVLANNELSPGGILGEGLLFEHVHFNFDGNYHLARAMFEKVQEALPQLGPSLKEGPIPSRQECAAALAYTPLNELLMTSRISDWMSKGPFVERLEQATQEGAARQRIERLRRSATSPQALKDTWKVYDDALAKAPDDWLLHENFGKLTQLWGRSDLAVEHFSIVAEKVPWVAESHAQLAAALYSVGKQKEAVEQYREALRLKPELVEALNNLGVLLSNQGQLAEAASLYRKALQLNPFLADAHNRLAEVLAAQGEMVEAIALYQRALELDAHFASAFNNLAWIRATHSDSQFRNGAEAVRLAERAVQLDGRKQAEVLDSLAAALAEAGRFKDAVATAEEGVALARATNQSALRDEIQSRLTLYRAGQAYRAPPHPPTPAAPGR